MFKSTTLKYPGPGAYPVLNSISGKGPQFLSKWKSSLASIFHPPKSTRFKDIPKEIKSIPGPGQYEIKPSLNSTGSYFISKFRSSLVRSFGVETRDSLTRGSVLTPGPGTYRSPSEFGVYRASEKLVKESERLEKNRMSLTRSNIRGSTTSRGNKVMGKSASQQKIEIIPLTELAKKE